MHTTFDPEPKSPLHPSSTEERQHRIPTVVPILVERAKAARTELRSLQTEAEQALHDLETADSRRRKVEKERAAAEREAEQVQKKIDGITRKKNQLEDMLAQLRAENDELEQSAETSGSFIKANASKAPANAVTPKLA